MHTLVLRDLEVRDLGAKLERVVEQLRAGDFRSAEVKKLKNADLYRARLDEKNRLLFKLGQHQTGRALLLLEVVHNHDYAKSRFLRGGSYSESDFEPVAAAPPAAATAEPLRYVNPSSTALHFLDKPLSFDDAQEAVFAAGLPLILVGSAGSGKTALTLEKLKTLPGRGLYLTRSAYLVENARALYHANGYENAGQEVEFLSLAELVETIDVPRGREARWADFTAWWSRVRGGFKLREPHKIWEEIRGVITGGAERAAYLTEDEYAALGVRQSIFLGDERRVVHQVFRKWLEHLRDAGLFDANMAAWERRDKATPVHDFLVVDEVQDITTVELRLALATLRDERAFLLCGDSNQIVHPNLFSWARVKSLFHERHVGQADSPLERIHILSANYRNTRAITDVANRLLLVKQRRFGSIDRESNYLVDCVSGEDGRVELVADAPAVRADIDQRTRRSARTAIIVLRDEDKPAARAAFATPLVFSVHEAKGLEYDNVVLFNVVSGAAREFRDCADGVTPEDLAGDLAYARSRDKTDKSLDAYKFYVNALYVGITRAVKSLLMVEADPAHPLLGLLAVTETADRISLAQAESSVEEWQREARRLELQGKTEQAEQIRREILQTEPVPWTVIDASSYADIHARAVEIQPYDRAAQQLLFEYALTYASLPALTELQQAGFRHAKKPESGRRYIAETYYAEYRFNRSTILAAQLRRHGVNFRNALNETPLIIAARLGRADLVADLVAQGADPELVDNVGRNPWRRAWSACKVEDGAFSSAQLGKVLARLPASPMKVKVGARMHKLDPSTMEWFLLNVMMADERLRVVFGLQAGHFPATAAADLARVFEDLPDSLLAPYRRRREYISSILAKNEHHSPNPYSRRLFIRLSHGNYIVSPLLELEHAGSWVRVIDFLGVREVLDSGGDLARPIRTLIDTLTRAAEATI